MDIRSFFHKIGIGFTRLGENSIPYTTNTKKYGNYGENEFVYRIRTTLPNCQIKKNVVINTLEGNAEIDCLILYNNKLFAIEIKRWKGELIEYNGQFIQHKLDRWTNERHTKTHKSPFRQLARAIYLLRKQVPEKAWINSIVYFEDAGNISANSENIWFDNIYGLIDYIQNSGQTSYANNAQKFFDKCIPADYLHSNSWDNSLHCVICDNSLIFKTPNNFINRKDISSITIKHHWSYDEMYIKTHLGITHNIKLENGHIRVIENGYIKEYALCKLNYIELGIR